jgi:hypothetical protein
MRTPPLLSWLPAITCLIALGCGKDEDTTGPEDQIDYRREMREFVQRIIGKS